MLLRDLFNFQKQSYLVKEKLFQKKLLIDNLKDEEKFNDHDKIFSEHHMSHAASAFYPSPFEEAIVLTADGVRMGHNNSKYRKRQKA